MKLNEATNMINILNTKIEILFDKYINNEKIDAFKTLKDDIEELVKDMERTNQEKINEYLKKYEYYFFNNFYLNNKKLNHRNVIMNLQKYLNNFIYNIFKLI